jgi:hypothetical protein
MAINTNIKAGRMVQMVSISCPSVVYLLNFFLSIIDSKMYPVKMVIRIKITIAWS